MSTTNTLLQECSTIVVIYVDCEQIINNIKEIKNSPKTSQNCSVMSDPRMFALKT